MGILTPSELKERCDKYNKDKSVAINIARDLDLYLSGLTSFDDRGFPIYCDYLISKDFSWDVISIVKEIFHQNGWHIVVNVLNQFLIKPLEETIEIKAKIINITTPNTILEKSNIEKIVSEQEEILEKEIMKQMLSYKGTNVNEITIYIKSLDRELYDETKNRLSILLKNSGWNIEYLKQNNQYHIILTPITNGK